MSNKLDLFIKDLYGPINLEQSIIASEVHRLLTILPCNYASYFPEIEDILAITAGYIEEGVDGQLAAVSRRLRNEKKISENYLQAFICSELTCSHIAIEKFEQYKALTLLVALRQSVNNDVQSRISSMCNEIRQLATGKRSNLDQYLPDISTLDLSALISNLGELHIDQNFGRIESATHRQLAAFYIPLQAAFNESIGHSRDNYDNKPNSLLARQLTNIDGDFPCNVSEINEISFTPKIDQHYVYEDAITSVVRKIYVIQNNSNENFAVKQARIDAIATQIKRNEMYLPCDLSTATRFEISSLLLSMTKADNSDLDDCEKLVLLSLILGVSIDSIRKQQVVMNVDNSFSGVLRTHKLPTHKKRNQGQYAELISVVNDSFVIPLPEKIVRNLDNLAFANVTDEMVGSFLKGVNKKFSTHLTTDKIANFLEQTCITKNQNFAAQALLRGVNIDHATFLYYFQVAESKIIYLHLKYLNYLGLHGQDQELFVLQTSSFSEDRLLGSPLKIDLNIIKAIFDVLQNRINDHLRKKKNKFNSECHNLLTILVLEVVSISSGYRPVKGGSGRFSAINLAQRELWISDKEMQIVDTSRVVKLPILCIKVIEKYIKYVKECIAFYSEKNSELCERYNEILTSEKELTFFIQNNKIMEVRPKVMEICLEEILPIPLNWYRHHIYSFLQEENADHELLNGLMGHTTTGGKTFSNTSSCSFREMDRIADSINKFLIKLGIKE